MIAFISFVLAVLASPFKSKSRLEAENAVLRHQLIVLRRRVRGRAQPTNIDRWFLVQMYRWFPPILKVVTIVQPETLVRWHRAGFRRYWRWKSRSRGGRARIEIELRALIRQMSTENQLWGAPRTHGELLKLGFSVAQSTVAKYMVKHRGPPSQGWRTFLRNHAPDIAAMDLFVVPTIGFELLYGFVIVRIDRRDLVWINVTTNPTAEWIARQITEAFPWDAAPGYMIRDRDRIYGAVVTRRLRAMGIRDSTGSESFVRTRSSAGFTIIASGFEFSVHTGANIKNAGMPSFSRNSGLNRTFKGIVPRRVVQHSGVPEGDNDRDQTPQLMPNVLIFRIELQNLSELDDRLMALPGIGERDRQICQNQLMIRRDLPGSVEMRNGFLGLSETMKQRALFDQGVQIP